MNIEMDISKDIDGKNKYVFPVFRREMVNIWYLSTNFLEQVLFYDDGKWRTLPRVVK